MTRLTLLFDLAPYVDEDAFFAWHVGLLSRACIAREQPTAAVGRSPTIAGGVVLRGSSSAFAVPRGFVTTLDWHDSSAFRDAFHTPEFQMALRTIESVALSSRLLIARAI